MINDKFITITNNYGFAPGGAAGHGMAGPGSARLGPARPGSAWLGLALLGSPQLLGLPARPARLAPGPTQSAME